jgi:hypothetical protein
MAQIAADAMEISYEKITVLHGSTSSCQGRLRRVSLTVDRDGRLSHPAGRRKAEGPDPQGRRAERLGCQARTRSSSTTNRSAMAAHQLPFAGLSETPLEVEAEFFNKKYTWAYGTQAAHVAVDPGTGHVKVLDYHVGRRCRPHHQSADLAWPGDRLDRAGPWRRVPGASGLRRRGAVADGLLRRLPDADRYQISPTSVRSRSS